MRNMDRRRARRRSAQVRRSTMAAMNDVMLVLLVILVVVFIWRGPKTIPKIGNALGRGVREARRQAAKEDPTAPENDKPD
jgi:Sec-independent protein translocase protein TatA